MRRAYPIVTIVLAVSLHVSLSAGCGGSSGTPDAAIFDDRDGWIPDAPVDDAAVDAITPVDGDGILPDGPDELGIDAGPPADAMPISEACPGMVVCSHLEEGYDIYCEEDGSVILDDLDIDGYCNPGETDVLCATGGQGDGQVIQHCSYGCIFATHFPLNDEQVSTLDLEELCLPYDGNDTDAGV